MSQLRFQNKLVSCHLKDLCQLTNLSILNVPTLRPMEIDEMIYFVVHPPTSIVPNKENGYDDEEPGKKFFFERCSNSFPKRMILSRMICPF